MTNWYGTNEIDQNDGLTAVYLGENILCKTYIVWLK